MKNYLDRKLKELKHLIDEGYNISFNEYTKEGGISGRIPALIDTVESFLCKKYGITNRLNTPLVNSTSKFGDFEKHIKAFKEIIPFRALFSEHIDKILKKHSKEGELIGYDLAIIEIIKAEKNPETALSEMIFSKEAELIKSDIVEPQRKTLIAAELNLLKLYHSQLSTEEKEYQKLQVITKPEILETLYIEIRNAFISEMNKEIFYNHFLTNNPNLEPINQIGNRYNFIYLFDCLTPYMNKAVLTTRNNNDRCDKWLSEHCTFEGKRIIGKDISTTRAKKKGEQPENILTINKIIEKIKKKTIE